VDAKYRQGCQVAETAAAPLNTGTSTLFSSRGRERGISRTTGTAGKGWEIEREAQGRVIDRRWKGWRRDAPSDVTACSNPLELPAGALSFATPGPGRDLLPRLLPRPDTQLSMRSLSSLSLQILSVKVFFSILGRRSLLSFHTF